MMRAQVEVDQITKAVRQVISSNFADFAVREIEIVDSEEFNDDSLMHIVVVFDRKPKDPGLLSGIVRLVRPKLLALKEEAFPVFSFVKSNEWDANPWSRPTTL